MTIKNTHPHINQTLCGEKMFLWIELKDGKPYSIRVDRDKITVLHSSPVFTHFEAEQVAEMYARASAHLARHVLTAFDQTRLSDLVTSEDLDAMHYAGIVVHEAANGFHYVTYGTDRVFSGRLYDCYKFALEVLHNNR